MKNKLITKVVAPICLAGAIALSGCTVVDSPNQNEKELVYEESFGANYCGMDEFYDEENRICSEDRIYDSESKPLIEEVASMGDYENELLRICSKGLIKYDDVVKLNETAKRVKIISREENFSLITSEIERRIIDAYYNNSEIQTKDLAMYIISSQKLKENSLERNEDVKVRLNTQIKLYGDYLKFADKWKNKDYVTTDKYLRISSLASWEEAKDNSEVELNSFFEKRGGKLENILEQFPVRVRCPKIPRWFWSTLGWLFPVVRNIGLTCWLTKNKPRTSRTLGGMFSGVVNSVAGNILLDGIHPLVFPIRMLATPIIIQPILKATKFYDKHDGENFIFED